MIGVGGMGEVYRATDTNLGRQVAIKVLPEEVAADAERLARFDREARTLAALNHPNIAQIYGLEKSGGRTALVLELVEGPTLADRIAEGPIPIEEALAIATQIADALEAAHEQGIVHRDLKPANVKLRPDRTVKVLDFGLAKALESAPGASSSVSMSPTITTPAHLRQGSGGQAMTQAGLILGTAAYMSPEQARGGSVDERADIWAVGCVLYEMLSGQRSFDGGTVSDVLASVLKSEPDYEKLPPATPRRLRSTLQRCLQKDLRQRWHHVADVRLELESVMHGSADDARDAKDASRRGSPRWLITGATGLTLVALAVVPWLLPERGAVGGLNGVVRFTMTPPEGVSVFPGWTHPKLLLSPDGRLIGFAGVDDAGVRQLWLRALDSEAARPVGGTEGVEGAFWSPDGEWLGVATADTIRRVQVSSGTVRTIADRRTIPQMRNILWGSENDIIFGGEGARLQRISASGGGDPDLLYESGDVPLWLEGLRDGRHFFFQGLESRAIYVGSINGAPPRLLLERNFDQRSALFYAPPYVLYVDEGVLWAHPFDETALALSGDPVAVLEDIPKSGAGYVPVAVSSDVLAYWPRQTGYPSVLTWKDRSGAVLSRVGVPAIYSGLALSPEGDQIAFARFGELGDRDVWARDSRGNEIRKTFDGDSTGPLFASDGLRVLFSSARGAPPNLHVLPVTGAGDERITQSGLVQTARSWGRDQDVVVYEERDPVNGFDL